MGQSGWKRAAQTVTVAAGVSIGVLGVTATACADTGGKADTGTASASTAHSATRHGSHEKKTPAGGTGPSSRPAEKSDIAVTPDIPPRRGRSGGANALRTLGAGTMRVTPTLAGPGTTRKWLHDNVILDRRTERTWAAPDSATAPVTVLTSEAAPVALAAAATPVRAGITTAIATAARATVTAAAPKPTLVGTLSALVFSVITALERVITGPPTVPAGSGVTVRSSSLQIGSQRVQADWYFPSSDTPPQHMILLQHGFFATAIMYSTTAAELAERTNSIVVAPTITSNPLADGGLWLNGAPMQEAVAQLFMGDRAALTESALAAGYATQYGLDPATALLPSQFVLAGHSAGGALVSVAAGYLVTHGAADDLMGVLLLDGVTSGGQLSSTLAELADYEQQTGRYIPVREIGAPPSLWNSISDVNSALSAARPDRFNGVVLAHGVHTDSMGGGSLLGEFLFHLIAGFPPPQNPPALRDLATDWINDWFAGRTDVGDDLVHGSTFTIDTPNGTATATVIGTPSVIPALAV